MAEPPPHLSPSGWNAWDKCPRAWASHYIDGITEPATAAMEVGTFAHGVLELLMDKAPGDRTVGAAREIARWLWNMGPRETTSIERGEITEAEFKARAWRAITGLWELEDPTETDVVATEEEITWTEGDVPMKVIVDRVDRVPRTAGSGGLDNAGLRVVDYKAGRLPAKKYQGSHKRQITIGAMGVASQSKENALGLAQAGVLLYVSADAQLGAATSREARRAVSEDAQRVWGEITAACEAEDFPPNPSILCQWCSCVGMCPEGWSQVRRYEAGVLRGYNPDAPGSRLVAALDAA